MIVVMFLVADDVSVLFPDDNMTLLVALLILNSTLFSPINSRLPSTHTIAVPAFMQFL